MNYPVPLHGQLGEAERPRPAIRRRGVRARRRAARGRRRHAVVRARRVGQGQGAPRTRSGETGRVPIWGARGTRSAAIFDVDGDGDLDIVTNEFNAAPMVLVSNLTEKTRVHYVAVELTGTTSNRDGLGAVVKVTAGGVDLHEGHGRQLRLPVAQPVSAVLRPRRRREPSIASTSCGRPARRRPCRPPIKINSRDRRARAVAQRPVSAAASDRSAGLALHRPVADAGVSRRLRDELRVEMRIRRSSVLASRVDRVRAGR